MRRGRWSGSPEWFVDEHVSFGACAKILLEVCERAAVRFFDEKNGFKRRELFSDESSLLSFSDRSLEANPRGLKITIEAFGSHRLHADQKRLFFRAEGLPQEEV